MNLTERERFIKRLLYQSCNRGCKETDLIIGQFAHKQANTINMRTGINVTIGRGEKKLKKKDKKKKDKD